MFCLQVGVEIQRAIMFLTVGDLKKWTQTPIRVLGLRRV